MRSELLMMFIRMALRKIKEWLNKNDEPKYLSGKNKEKLDDTI